MERILWLYSPAYDPLYSVACFDERPCFLIGDQLEPIKAKEGSVEKIHYAYQKNGSCCLLAAIEPLRGVRIGHVYERRTQREYTLFMKDLAAAYPNARKIRLVQDNLNTHNTSSFYKHLPADEAFKLAQRFEFFYTPKSASWLNMIEIEFSAISKQCLNRRIATIEQLKEEVKAIIKERNQKRIKINWQFSIPAARQKLKRAYSNVNFENTKL